MISTRSDKKQGCSIIACHSLQAVKSLVARLVYRPAKIPVCTCSCDRVVKVPRLGRGGAIRVSSNLTGCNFWPPIIAWHPLVNYLGSNVPVNRNAPGHLRPRKLDLAVIGDMQQKVSVLPDGLSMLA